MESSHINVLITSFNGLGLPKTLCLPLPRSTPVRSLWTALDSRLASRLDDATFHALVLTTNSNTALPHHSPRALATLTAAPTDALLPLRLAHPLCGGKGGFGSQLRAAGGRMSSKRKKGGGDPNASSRNLDGRRLRTVTEAKALAEYLAIKPEMERQEKEKRRQRWTAIVDAAERREEEIRDVSRTRMDGQWMELKEEVGEKTREAVLAAMKEGIAKDVVLGTSAGSASSTELAALQEDSAEDTADRSSGATSPVSDEGKGNGRETAAAAKPRTFFGFDEDDEFMSSDDEEDSAKK